jgi:two-component system, cell cycle sensor histidine kinase and response regulator CckA
VRSDKSTEELLRFTQFALDHLPDAAYWVEEDSSITYVNEAACRMLGYSKAELLSKRIYELNPELPASLWPAMWQKLKQDGRRVFETRHRAKDGRVIPVEIASNFVEYGGKESSWAFARDISARKELEARLRQAEKMEAIGQLAGGVAHDFNNQLACILSNAELLKYTSAPAEHDRLVDNVLLAVTRSASLTAQLLAFSRRGQFRSEPVDLHRVISEVVTMLSHSIDKKIQINTSTEATRTVTAGDPSQLQNAVLNLALNARDAMPHGGHLRFATRNITLAEPPASGPAQGAPAGQYIELSVADDGLGMDEATQQRLFEPFFTTKELGKGTGLGLAAVYGTIKTHKGWVTVKSQKGEGTSIALYLPVGAAAPLPRDEPKPPGTLSGPVRILLVDDEALVREATQRLLQLLGCEVTVCSDGAQALEFYSAFYRSIDLVILDLMMPGKDSADTVLGMRAIHPDGKILLVSGYSQESAAQAIASVDGFIHKPYSQAQLWDKVVQILSRAD